MNRFHLIAAVLFLSLQSTWADRIELREVVDADTAGAIEMERKDPAQGGPVLLAPNAIFTDADVATAKLYDEAGSYWVSVMVKDGSQTGFEEATKALLGSPLAIIVDQQVLSTPVVQAPLSSGFMISGNFTKAEAEELVAAFSPDAH